MERELALLDRQEQALRADDFRDQAQSATSGRPVASAARESSSAVDQVRITVVGEGQLHLRGPLEGVNAIARMIHEIDQPVGQVKLGIHVVQFTAQDGAAFDGVPGLVDRYLAHARQMSETSQSLFRAAMSAVAARYYSLDPNGFEEAFFYSTCVRNFRSLNGAQATVSVALLDSRDIVTTLYLASLATNEARHEILAEFQRLVAAELPRLHQQYQQAIAAAQGQPAKPPSLLARVMGTGAPAEADHPPAPRLSDLSFSKTLSYLEPYSAQPNSVHPIQIATARFQRALLELRQAEAAVAAMRNDRLLLAFTSSHRPPSAHFLCIPDVVERNQASGRDCSGRAIRPGFPGVLGNRGSRRQAAEGKQGEGKQHDPPRGPGMIVSPRTWSRHCWHTEFPTRFPRTGQRQVASLIPNVGGQTKISLLQTGAG